jgi:hypothetical protein
MRKRPEIRKVLLTKPILIILSFDNINLTFHIRFTYYFRALIIAGNWRIHVLPEKFDDYVSHDGAMRTLCTARIG